jgi:hypothetical protein
MWPVPEFINPVFVKTSPKRSFSLIENDRFELVFAKTGSINSGTGVPGRQPYAIVEFIPPVRESELGLCSYVCFKSSMIFTAILEFYVLYCIQHCFICRPSDSTVLEDAALRTVATFALLVRHSIPQL